MTKSQRYLINLTKDDLKEAAKMHENFFHVYSSPSHLPDGPIIMESLNEMRQMIADYRAAVETAIERLNAVV